MLVCVDEMAKFLEKHKLPVLNTEVKKKKIWIDVTNEEIASEGGVRGTKSGKPQSQMSSLVSATKHQKKNWHPFSKP